MRTGIRNLNSDTIEKPRPMSAEKKTTKNVLLRNEKISKFADWGRGQMNQVGIIM